VRHTPSGNFLLADFGNFAVRLLLPDGSTRLLAGTAQVNGRTDGAAGVGRVTYVYGLTDDYNGKVYVADSANRLGGLIRAITYATGVLSTIAGNTAPSDAFILANAPTAGKSWGYANGVGTSAQIPSPSSITLDPVAGVVYVADASSMNLRRLDLATSRIEKFVGDDPTAPAVPRTGYQNGPIAIANFMCVRARQLARVFSVALLARCSRSLAPALRALRGARALRYVRGGRRAQSRCLRVRAPPPCNPPPRRSPGPGFMTPALGADSQIVADCRGGYVRRIHGFVASPSASPSASRSATRSASPSPSPSSPCGVFTGSTFGLLPGNFNPGPYNGNNIRVRGGCAIDYVSIDPGGSSGTDGGDNVRITQVCGGGQFVAFGFALAGRGNPGCINGRTSTFSGQVCNSGNSGWSGLSSIGPFACKDGTVDPQSYTSTCTPEWRIADYTYTLPARLCAADA
jgi:hypothetical protein